MPGKHELRGGGAQEGPQEGNSLGSIAEQRSEVRGWQHLTLLEQVVGGVVFLAILDLVLALAHGIPLWIAGPILAGLYSVVGGAYARRSRPRYGPKLRQRNHGGPRTYANSLSGRARAYWRVPGRRGILVLAVGLFLAVAGFGNAASDSSLLSDLRAHGVHGSALVVSVSTSTDRYGQTNLDAASVRFEAKPGQSVMEDLQIIDTVPISIRKGQRVAVVFDPNSPDQVLLASAMSTDDPTWDYAVGISGLVATLAGIIWWRVGRRRRRIQALAD